MDDEPDCSLDCLGADFIDRLLAGEILTREQMETKLAEQRCTIADLTARLADTTAKLAQSTNYVADDDTYPHVVTFANGRRVSIASGGHLEVDRVEVVGL